MIAQLILIALLSGVLLYAWSQYSRSPVVGLLSLVTSVVGLYLVCMPSHATKLAEWTGIGRGVDLIIYTWMVISLVVLLNLHLKIRAQLELITQLARAVAISNAILPSNSAESRLDRHQTRVPGPLV